MSEIVTLCLLLSLLNFTGFGIFAELWWSVLEIVGFWGGGAKDIVIKLNAKF